MYIKTNRLIIREFDMSMTESVHLNSLDEDTRRFVPDEVFETVQEAEEIVEQLIACYKSESGPFVYPIVLNDGINIGYVQAIRIGQDWEIGYHIARDYTGRGYATEAVGAFLPVIMSKLKIFRIYGICHHENQASIHVLKKNGFVLEYSEQSNHQNDEVKTCRYIFNM